MSNCLQCSNPIKGLKEGAKFCSGACRTKYSRAVKAGKIAKPKKEKLFPPKKGDVPVPGTEGRFSNLDLFIPGGEVTMTGKEYFEANMAQSTKNTYPELREYEVLIIYLKGEGITQQQAIKIIKKSIIEKAPASKQQSLFPPDGLTRTEKLKWITEHKK